jgi:7-carboxy-7-deazaguanine synthase
MWIAETFQSVQGEGRYAGTPSLFIRTSGCNLRCWFCDTPYTSWEPEGEQRTAESLLDEVRSADCEHVVITGGEPLLVPQLVPFTRSIAELGRLITIETAGTVDLPVTAGLMSISPKLANSTPDHPVWRERHDRRRHRPEVIRRLTRQYDYQLKFVIDKPGDVADVESYLAVFPHITPDNVYLMPQARDREPLREKNAWLEPLAASRGWQVSPRLHIELFGNTRGT